MKSKPIFAPNSRSFISRSERYGMESSTPGTFMPLLSDISPPWITVVWISFPETLSTLSSTAPSLIRMAVPCFTSWGRPLKEIEAISLSHTLSSVVRMNLSPSQRVTGALSANFPRRISGPFVSRRAAIGSPSSSRSLQSWL